MHKLHRANFSPSTSSVVCTKNFNNRFIIREGGVKRSHGTKHVITRKETSCPNFN